jgi:hypothetical protein
MMTFGFLSNSFLAKSKKRRDRGFKYRRFVERVALKQAKFVCE